jgi:hypothetical protein
VLDAPRDRHVRGELDRLAVVGDLERRAVEERVHGLALRHLDLEPPPAEEEPEGEPREPWRQPRHEAELAVVVAHAAEAGDRREPCSGERRDVDPVARVALEVVQVHQRRLPEVVVREV